MRYFLLAIVVMAVSGFKPAHNQITTFEGLMDALKSGKPVKAVFHYHKCKLFMDGEEKPAMPEIIGGMNIDTYEYFGEKSVGNPSAFVVASTSKLIANPIGKGYVWNYAKVKVRADNTVDITARYLDAKSFKVKMDETFKTSINDSENDAGAYFYTVE